MAAWGKRMAAVALVTIALTASTAWGQIGCCQCQDCAEIEACLTLPEGFDEEACANFCNFYQCSGKALVATVSGCQVGAACEKVVSVNSTPALSTKGLGLAALLTLGFGTIAVRRRQRRRSAFAQS